VQNQDTVLDQDSEDDFDKEDAGLGENGTTPRPVPLAVVDINKPVPAPKKATIPKRNNKRKV
jgi:hypothetical protein